MAVCRARWRVHLLVIGAYPLALGLLGWGRGPVRGPALGSNARDLVWVCGFEMLVFGAVFGLAWLASRASREDLRWRWRGGPWIIPLSLGYSVLLRVAVAVIVLFLALFVVAVLLLTRVASAASLQDFVTANRPDVGALVDISALGHDPLYFWLSVSLTSFLVAGFREELWRSAFLVGMGKLWPREFGARAGQLGAAAVGAVIFGLGHLAQGPLAVLVTGLLGFGLGVIMVLHRSIWPAVLAHGLFDATTFALLAVLPGLLDKVPHWR